MMYPERMDRVTVVAPTHRTEQLISTLYRHGVLHIIEHVKGTLDIGSPLPGSARMAELLVQARSLLHSLGIQQTPDSEPAAVRGDLTEQLQAIHAAASTVIAEEKRLTEQLERTSAEAHAYAGIAWLHVDPVKLRESKHLSYFFGTLKEREGLAPALQAITPRVYIEEQHGGHGVFVLIEHEKSGEARALLQERGFAAADHARILALDRPLEQRLSELRAEQRSLHRQLETVSHQKHALAREHGAFLLAAERVLAVEARKAQAPLRFAVSKRSVFVNGWVPTSSSAALVTDLERDLGSEVYAQVSQPLPDHHAKRRKAAADHGAKHGHAGHTPQEEPPIKLDNSFFVSPYEALLRLYTLPKYHEIDPSTLLCLSFPIFFGFMLGDIGYGLLLLALFMVARATAKGNLELKAISSIFIMSAVSTVIFGIVFGEFFGLEHIGHYELHPIIHRAEDMTTLMYVAVAIGIVHITVGLLVGYVNELRHHGQWKAFCAKISWLILLAAAGLAAVGYFSQNPLLFWGGLALIVASAVLIYLGEGIKGLVEIIGIVSNIMSYARLMALGVASAALAIVVNEMAGGLFAKGPFGVIAGILVLIAGHGINFILGIIGPFLHSLRLHYVEFFSKFYEGGGKPYKPFGVDER